MKNDKWGNQMKTNFNLGAGLSLSIPIFDNRSTKTAIRKALLDKQSSIIALENERTAIYSDIENYWLEATNNQDKYKAAKVSSESYEESYKLLSEQFELGLKNIVELMTGKYNLLNAQQTELQSKYLAIYNISMLEFYQDGAINTENYGKK
jgi:outer membrane protein